ncbi:MAG: hypothetical protein HY541_05920 [Deltaproteobacteria bacterium]|nr:hypothetical protein [Deltaproteobacteria bacterium]MBI4412001.1 hypothetical protein [Deltaproteobacteria bacterium]
MAIISANTTSSTFGDSSRILALLESMEENSSLQETDASRQKERHFDSQISLQKEKVNKMEEQIKAQFSSGLLKNIVSLATSVVASVINFKLSTMPNVASPALKAAQAKIANALKMIAGGIQKLANFVLQFDPFAKKAQQAGVDVEKLQKDILAESKQTEQAQDVEKRARESRAKTEDAMNSYVRLKNEAESAIAKN